MKKLILLTLALGIVHSISAQQVFFKEDFTHMPGLPLSQGWQTKQSGTVGWRTSDMYDLYCSYSVVPQYKFFDHVAAISGCYGKIGGPRNNTNVFAYTKGINLKNAQGGVVLKYDSYFNRMNVYFKYEIATVEVSVNDGASWTVVQNVAGGQADSFTTWYVDLSQYAGYGNVRIGFRYSDQGVDHKLGGWAIDDIEVYEPAKLDMELKEFSPLDSLLGYVAQNSSIDHYGTVVNRSLDTIKSFTVNYRRGNSYVLSDVINATVPPLSEYSFAHAVPDTISAIGRTDITAWVDVTGDTNPDNDTAKTFVYGAHFMPLKLVLVEEGTSTKNEYGPRGHVYMQNLSADNELCQVSIHSQDPMAMEDYSSFLYSLNYYSGQYFLLDRQFVEPTELFKQFNNYKKHFGFADLEVTGNVFLDVAEIYVNIKPAIDMQGDFRLVLILTESDVSGTTKEFNQVNGYMDNFQGWGPMGGYENKTNPVLAKDMKYNNVARLVEPSIHGVSIGTELKHGGSYQKYFKVNLDDSWNKNRMSAIVMLYSYDDTLILNSNRLSYFLNVSGTDKLEKETGLFPNPANDFTMLEFEAKQTESVDIIVTDISGRKVKNIQLGDLQQGKNLYRLNTADFSNGLYLVSIATGEVRNTLKLQIIH